ncbi:MAG: DegT/DnrJ/EryC1/StrS family aminotransferase, partial [Pseudobdellovibrionaceae bacterium]
MNYRIPDILCALGLSQLKRLDANLQSRRALARRYDEQLKGLPLKTPPAPDNVRNAFHLYVIQTDKRKELYDFLKSKDIYCQVHYIPIYRQPFYIEKYGRMSLPVMDKYYSQCLSLPMYHAMTEAEQNTVISKIREFFGA